MPVPASKVGRASSGTAVQCQCSIRVKTSGHVDLNDLALKAFSEEKMRLHVSKHRCHKVGRCGCYSGKLGLEINASKPDICKLTG